METRALLAVTRVTIHHEVATSVSQRLAPSCPPSLAEGPAVHRDMGKTPLPAKNTFTACRKDGRAEPQDGGQGQERLPVVALATWVLGGPTGAGLPLHAASAHCPPALIIAPFFLRFLRAHEAPLGSWLYVVLRSRKYRARGTQWPRRVSRQAWGTPRVL